MLITQIESQLRRFTGVSTTQYTQAEFLEDINIVKDEFWSAIVGKLDEDSNYDIWTTTPVALQVEYTIPEVASDTAGAKILKGISIAYNDDTYTDTGLLQYTKAREVSPDSLSKEWNYYAENQPTNDPIFYVADNSYWIAPAVRSDEVQTNGIKLTGIRKIADYTIATTEVDLKIPVDYQRILLWGVIPYALMSKRADNNQIVKAQQDYNNEKTLALQNMSSRREGPIYMKYPDNNNTDTLGLTD